MRKFNTIDYKEVHAASITVQQAADNHSQLSGYVGSSAVGGPMCVNLEQTWEETFGINHAVAVNSATSGLLAACMAIGVCPGSDVIVSPYTMSATAAVPKILGANIVFADIESETFGLDPASVKSVITPRTKAVIVTNLFGHPARLSELKNLCGSYGVYLIEDNAQSIFAKEGNKYAGTIGDIGVFSLNVHKQIQTGEGGVAVTNDDQIAWKLREAMNHGEMRGGILGLNLRMTEVTAALACEQLKKAGDTIKRLREFAMGISYYIDKLELPIAPPMVRHGCAHSYYCWAGTATGPVNIAPPFRRGYMRPLYEMNALRQYITVPITLPVVEEVEKNLVLLELCSISSERTIEDMVRGLWIPENDRRRAS